MGAITCSQWWTRGSRRAEAEGAPRASARAAAAAVGRKRGEQSEHEIWTSLAELLLTSSTDEVLGAWSRNLSLCPLYVNLVGRKKRRHRERGRERESAVPYKCGTQGYTLVVWRPKGHTALQVVRKPGHGRGTTFPTSPFPHPQKQGLHGQPRCWSRRKPRAPPRPPSRWAYPAVGRSPPTEKGQRRGRVTGTLYVDRHINYSSIIKTRIIKIKKKKKDKVPDGAERGSVFLFPVTVP